MWEIWPIKIWNLTSKICLTQQLSHFNRCLLLPLSSFVSHSLLFFWGWCVSQRGVVESSSTPSPPRWGGVDRRHRWILINGFGFLGHLTLRTPVLLDIQRAKQVIYPALSGQRTEFWNLVLNDAPPPSSLRLCRASARGSTTSWL